MMLSQKRRTDENTLDTSLKLKKVKMESFAHEIESGLDNVIMPWEDNTEIMVTRGDQVTKVCSRWELIQEKLHDSTPILNVNDLICVIKSYNPVFEQDGRQVKPPWNCLVLSQYFNQLSGCEREKFFQENGVLSTIRNLALELRKLVPRLKLLRTGVVSSIKLHQLQIASILANAFFCTFPKGKADCPSINFNTLYESSSSSVVNYYLEKIKCIMHYFRKIHNKQPTGNLSFHRLVISDHKFPRWDKTTADLCSLKVDVQGRIEDQEGHLQMDFANRYVGGGVLGRGCVQEEIRFIICPELIAARLFTESLADNEALFVIGAERYCRYSGYSSTFEFAGDYEDTTPFDEDRHRKTYLIVLDALYFRHSSEQYRESKILRELKKAYVGFKPMEQNHSLPLATGNWGCGAFGGDPELKTILQLMASSQARRDMLYLTFGNSAFKNQIDDLYRILKERSVNTGMLYRIIRLYSRERRKNQTLFEFIKESVSKAEKRKFSPMSAFPSHTKQKPPCFEFLNEDEMSAMEEAWKTKFLQNRHSKDAKKSTDGFYPEFDMDFDTLDKEVENSSRPSVQVSENDFRWREPEAVCSTGSILDRIWFENEVKKPSGKSESEKMEADNLRNSPSLFSDDEEKSPDVGVESRQADHVTDSSHQDTVKDDNRTEIPAPVQGRKLFQPKITDCFRKK